MDKHYYYTGTDYSTMHPFHWDFWYHLILPWGFYNWVWLILIFLWLWVRFNDNMIRWIDK